MEILVTGASGVVGTAIIEHLDGNSNYNFTYVDIRDHPKYEIVTADVLDYDAMHSLFKGKDAVIHLALIPGLSAWSRDVGWSEPLSDNLQGINNVLEAAVKRSVEKVIFASSNHAVGMYEVEGKPDIYSLEDDLRADNEIPPRPDSLYGLTKVYGEALGRLCSEAHGIRFYALRLGAVNSKKYDHPYGYAERGVNQGKWERGSEEYDLQLRRLRTL